MKFFIGLILTVFVSSNNVVNVAGECFSPYVQVEDMCFYVEEMELLSWKEARDYCSQIAGDGMRGDLLTTPSCLDFTFVTRYLEINGYNGTYWMGATKLSGGSWNWLTLESLQTGVPFFAWDEGEMPGERCAMTSAEKDYQLMCNDCSTPRGFICGVPQQNTRDIEPRPGPEDDCRKEGAVMIGDECYVFSDHTVPWAHAEEECRKHHEAQNGQLFFPETCEEYTQMAHHLEADEKSGDYWVGAIDTTGNQAWTWTTGANVPGGVPFWAYGEPNHADDGEANKHCGIMDSGKRYYLTDDLCNTPHMYICKIKLNS